MPLEYLEAACSEKKNGKQNNKKKSSLPTETPKFYVRSDDFFKPFGWSGHRHALHRASTIKTEIKTYVCHPLPFFMAVSTIPNINM